MADIDENLIIKLSEYCDDNDCETCDVGKRLTTKDPIKREYNCPLMGLCNLIWYGEKQ